MDHLLIPRTHGTFVPNCIRNRTDLSWFEKFFLCETVLIDKETKGNYVYDINSISDQFFVTKPTIYKCIKNLIKIGLIDVISCVSTEDDVKRIIKPCLTRIFTE